VKLLLTSQQGLLIRELSRCLASHHSIGWPPVGLILETIESWPWSSLTFTGERHHIVVRLPTNAPTLGTNVESSRLEIAGSIVAVEHAAWDGPRLTIDLLTIATKVAPDAEERAMPRRRVARTMEPRSPA